jgi:hypothetical protein
LSRLDDAERRAALIPERASLAEMIARADDATLRRLCLALVVRIVVTRSDVTLQMI